MEQEMTEQGRGIQRVGAKRLSLGRLCFLVLGVALSACSPSEEEGPGPEEPHTVYTVVFDSNGGTTEAVPASKTVTPPATTLDALPAPPSREGYVFDGWNTARNGTGMSFTPATHVTRNLTVYAQWVPLPHLSVEIIPSTQTLTPITDGAYSERSATVTVRVPGVGNNADASSVELDIGPVTGLSFASASATTGGTKTFSTTVLYDGITVFDNGGATLSFNLRNIPEGYLYVGGPQTTRMDIVDGLEATRPIPVNQANIAHFNRYTTTPEGLERHYQLTENVTLPMPAAGQSNWVAIGKWDDGPSFTGSFDGGNFTITGLTIHAPYGHRQGLFGAIGESAVIKNLGLEDVSFTGNSGGGLVGGNWSHATVQNCVALSPSVIATTTELGCVEGFKDGVNSTLSNNYARSNMVLTYNNGTAYEPIPGAHLKDGEAVDAPSYNSLSFWETAAWDFDSVWGWKAGTLPILRNVGGEQNPMVP